MFLETPIFTSIMTVPNKHHLCLSVLIKKLLYLKKAHISKSKMFCLHEFSNRGKVFNTVLINRKTFL